MKQIILFTLLFISTISFAQTESEELFEKAKKKYDAESYEDALGLLNKSIKKDKNNDQALFYRGMTKMQMDDYQGAEKDFSKIIKLYPNNYLAYINRGNVYSHEENYTYALKDFDKALALHQEDPLAYRKRAEAYFELKKFDLAADDYTSAIKLKPKNIVFLYHRRSECYNYAKKNELAKKDLETILSIDSSEVVAKTNLAFCYITDKEYKKAEKLYLELYAADNEEPFVLSNFGYVKHVLGDTKGGLELINKSLEYKSDNAYAYKYMALVYIDTNDLIKACEAIEKGLSFGFTNSYGPELEELKKSTCE